MNRNPDCTAHAERQASYEQCSRAMVRMGFAAGSAQGLLSSRSKLVVLATMADVV